MKFVGLRHFVGDEPVAPHWGAWIEINQLAQNMADMNVAPHWGAWIEITVAIGG